MEKENRELVSEFLRKEVVAEESGENQVAKELLKKVILYERENGKLKQDIE